MKLKFDDESRAKAVRAGACPGENINAVAHCALSYSQANDYGFVLLTDYSLKMVSLKEFDTYKIKDTFEIPYSGISNIKFSDRFYAKLIKFRFNGYKYTLVLYKNAKYVSYQAENIDVILHFFTNLKNMQRAS
jgi:hypothetical protein